VSFRRRVILMELQTYHDLSALSDPMIYLSGLGQFLFDICLYGFVSGCQMSSMLGSPDLIYIDGLHLRARSSLLSSISSDLAESRARP